MIGYPYGQSRRGASKQEEDSESNTALQSTSSPEPSSLSSDDTTVFAKEDRNGRIVQRLRVRRSTRRPTRRAKSEKAASTPSPSSESSDSTTSTTSEWLRRQRRRRKSEKRNRSERRRSRSDRRLKRRRTSSSFLDMNRWEPGRDNETKRSKQDRSHRRDRRDNRTRGNAGYEDMRVERYSPPGPREASLVLKDCMEGFAAAPGCWELYDQALKLAFLSNGTPVVSIESHCPFGQQAKSLLQLCLNADGKADSLWESHSCNMTGQMQGECVAKGFASNESDAWVVHIRGKPEVIAIGTSCKRSAMLALVVSIVKHNYSRLRYEDISTETDLIADTPFARYVQPRW